MPTSKQTYDLAVLIMEELGQEVSDILSEDAQDTTYELVDGLHERSVKIRSRRGTFTISWDR